LDEQNQTVRNEEELVAILPLSPFSRCLSHIFEDLFLASSASHLSLVEQLYAHQRLVGLRGTFFRPPFSSLSDFFKHPPRCLDFFPHFLRIIPPGQGQAVFRKVIAGSL